MNRRLWLQQHRWLLAGMLLGCIVLLAILTIWGVQAHQYQLALAHYTATLHQSQQPSGPDYGLPKTPPTPPGPPVDTSGPGAWGWSGWIIRLFALLIPLSLGLLLQWWEQRRRQYVLIHKAHLDHATNRLAEAIGVNQELPTGVFDAYSKLRELEPPAPRTRSLPRLRRGHQGSKRSK